MREPIAATPHPAAYAAPVHWGWTALITAASMAGMLAYRVPHLRDALFSDESMYVIKAALFKSGGLPHRDLWDHHPPGLELFLSLLPMSFLQAEACIRLVSVLLLGGAVLFAADLLRRARVNFWAILAGAAVFTIFHCLDWFSAFYVEPEQFMVLSLTLMAWMLWTRKPPAWAWFFWGLTTTFKQSGVVFFPLLLYLDFSDEDRRKQCGGWSILSRILAASAPWLVIMAYFSFRGGLTDLIREVVFDALRRRGETDTFYCSRWFRWGLCRDFHVLLYGLAAVALAGGRRLLAIPVKRTVFALGLLWLGSAMLYLWIQKCGLQYYYAVATPGLLWLTAWAFDSAGSLLRDARSGIQRVTQGLLLTLLLIGALLAAVKITWNRVPSWLPSTAYNHNCRALARLLKSSLPASYRVLAVQDYPGWYWYLGQPPPRVVWIHYYLHIYPERQRSFLDETVAYGRGKILLLVYMKDPDRRKPQLAELREQLRLRGARPVALSDLLSRKDLPQEFEADLLDLRASGNQRGAAAAAD